MLKLCKYRVKKLRNDYEELENVITCCFIPTHAYIYALKH